MKKFIHYCLYAFGIPITVISIIALLNEYEIISEGWRTNIGSHSCMVADPLDDFSDEALLYSLRAQWIYMFGPIMVILLINVGFYSLTAYTIYSVQKDVQKFSRGERSKHAKQETAR